MKLRRTKDGVKGARHTTRMHTLQGVTVKVSTVFRKLQTVLSLIIYLGLSCSVWDLVP